MELLVAALAFVLGLMIGTGVGVARAFRLAARQRAALGASSAIARLWPEAMPERSAADILAGRIRVILGGLPYDLPVLPRGASKRWIESLDSQYRTLALALDVAGDDMPRILTMVGAHQDALLDMLISYDQTGVLPPRDHLDEYATDAEILRAVIEVWRAANPLVATLAEMATDEPTAGSSRERPSSPPMPTAGVPTTSTSS